jgi:hypothetical protein
MYAVATFRNAESSAPGSVEAVAAAASSWVAAGVPPTQVAEWAGHSVAVLLQIYAKCLAGQEDAARRRIAAALGES